MRWNLAHLPLFSTWPACLARAGEPASPLPLPSSLSLCLLAHTREGRGCQGRGNCVHGVHALKHSTSCVPPPSPREPLVYISFRLHAGPRRALAFLLLSPSSS